MAKQLKEGDKAPVFSLLSDTGEKISLSDFKGQRVVIYFYPKDMTPGCTQESCDFRDHNAEFKKKKAVILGVSKDPVDSHEKFKNKYKLPFTLLSDESGEVCEDYGVWKEKSMYGKSYMGIERTTFVVDENGKIQKIYPKVKVEGHIDEILKDL